MDTRDTSDERPRDMKINTTYHYYTIGVKISRHITYTVNSFDD